MFPTHLAAAPPEVTGRGVLAAASAAHLLAFWHITVTISTAVDLGMDLALSPPRVLWVAIAYTLPVAALLVSGGAMAQRFGSRRALLGGSLLMGAGAFLGAAAPGLALVLAGQVLCGVGAAVVLPASLVAVGRAFPRPQARTQALAVWVAAAGAGLTSGPLVSGGLLAGTGSWRAPFVSTLIVAALVVIAVTRYVPRHAGSRRTPDIAGQLLVVVVVVALVVAVMEAGGARRAGLLVLLAAVVVAGVAGLAGVEHRAGDPVVPMGLFRDRRFVGALLIAGVGLFAFVGVLLVHVVLFQQALQLSAWQTALRLTPATAGFAVLAVLGGRWSSLRGQQEPAVVGLLVAAAGVATSAVSAASGPALVNDWPGLLGLLLLGAGSGLLLVPATAAAVLGVAPEKAPAAASLVNASRQLGAVLGASVLGSVLTGRLPDGDAGGPSPSDVADGLSAGVAVAAVVLALTALAAVATLRPTPRPEPWRHPDARRRHPSHTSTDHNHEENR